MTWRVGENVYDVSNYSEEVRTKVYKKWRSNNETIECLCHQTNGQYPLMHIKKSSKGVYFLSNNGNNTKHRIDHAPDCFHNTHFRRSLGAKGVRVDEDGTLYCSLKELKGTQHTKSQPTETSKIISNSREGSTGSFESSLRFIFLALLEKNSIQHYKSKQLRNIDKRLFKASCETFINQVKLNEVLYLVNENFRYFFKKHQFIVGWGKRDHYRTDGKFISIPMYSISDPNQYIYDHKVPNWIFKDTTFTGAAVSSGYWVIWRDRDENGQLKDKQIIFVPAEEQTMIPVDSSLEEQMINHLVSSQINFRKPQIRATGDYFLPDFILEGKKDTIIEVAGLLDDPDYFKKLKEKEIYYKNNGYQYIEWNGKDNLNSLNIDPKE